MQTLIKPRPSTCDMGNISSTIISANVWLMSLALSEVLAYGCSFLVNSIRVGCVFVDFVGVGNSAAWDFPLLLEY